MAFQKQCSSTILDDSSTILDESRRLVVSIYKQPTKWRWRLPIEDLVCGNMVFMDGQSRGEIEKELERRCWLIGMASTDKAATSPAVLHFPRDLVRAKEYYLTHDHMAFFFALLNVMGYREEQWHPTRCTLWRLVLRCAMPPCPTGWLLDQCLHLTPHIQWFDHDLHSNWVATCKSTLFTNFTMFLKDQESTREQRMTLGRIAQLAVEEVATLPITAETNLPLWYRVVMNFHYINSKVTEIQMYLSEKFIELLPLTPMLPFNLGDSLKEIVLPEYLERMSGQPQLVQGLVKRMTAHRTPLIIMLLEDSMRGQSEVKELIALYAQENGTDPLYVYNQETIVNDLFY